VKKNPWALQPELERKRSVLFLLIEPVPASPPTCETFGRPTVSPPFG